MQKVSIIQREIPHYRIRFFEELYTQGKAINLDITVYTGAAPPSPSPGFPFHVLPLRYFGQAKTATYWMRGLQTKIKGSDVIVAPQELQCLTVPYLWTRRNRICRTWIWWGHGYNFQAAVRPSVFTNVKEAIKHFMTRRGDGVITYTAKGAEYWSKRGVPADRIFPYYNTIDVEGLREMGEAVTEQQLINLRQTLGLEGKHVFLFSGRLYAEKKVDFLLNVFAHVKVSHRDVALLIIGDGDERKKLEQLAAELRLQDVHFLGELTNPKILAAYFRLADMMVLPSYAGLAIVHGFTFGLPLITTDSPGHGPELDYLSEENGVMTQFDVRACSKTIETMLSDPLRLSTLKRGAWAYATDLHLNTSARRFTTAIQALRLA